MGNHSHSHTHHQPSLTVTPPSSDTPEELQRYQETKKITIVGAVVNLVLAVLKIVIGYIGHSQSLVADGVHSLSDLLTDVLVVVAARHAAQDADADHPYGHGRFETVFTVALGSFLIIVGGGIAIDAIRRVAEPDALLQPTLWTLVIAATSIASKEILYHYTMRVAKKFRSNMLRANAWHHRTDAISSIIVFIGIGGTMLGMNYLDAVAAVGVALLIGKIGWELCAQSIRELVDTALDPERVEKIEHTIQSVPGVNKLHMLRTRQMGGNALVDVHIQVAPKLSVSEGHYISEKVRARLIKHVDEVTDVMVHIDPEDDEKIRLGEHLPPREVVLERLRAAWADIPESKFIERTTLHYLDGKIQVELLLPLSRIDEAGSATRISEAFSKVTRDVEIVADIKIMYH
ncbi:MAG: cation diffusion facilitator family transporter [Gammaproteobacteria bacterium]